jgi:hypothetical protein
MAPGKRGWACSRLTVVGLTIQRFTRKTHPRACGQAARRLPRLTVQPAGDVCKRRDAVRLALNEPARPAGA